MCVVHREYKWTCDTRHYSWISMELEYISVNMAWVKLHFRDGQVYNPPHWELSTGPLEKSTKYNRLPLLQLVRKKKKMQKVQEAEGSEEAWMEEEEEARAELCCETPDLQHHSHWPTGRTQLLYAPVLIVLNSEIGFVWLSYSSLFWSSHVVLIILMMFSCSGVHILVLEFFFWAAIGGVAIFYSDLMQLQEHAWVGRNVVSSFAFRKI